MSMVGGMPVGPHSGSGHYQFTSHNSAIVHKCHCTAVKFPYAGLFAVRSARVSRVGGMPGGPPFGSGQYQSTLYQWP